MVQKVHPKGPRVLPPKCEFQKIEIEGVFRPYLKRSLSERINWIISIIPHRITKNFIVYGSYEFLAMLEGKIRETPFFKGSIQ